MRVQLSSLFLGCSLLIFHDLVAQRGWRLLYQLGSKQGHPKIWSGFLTTQEIPCESCGSRGHLQNSELSDVITICSETTWRIWNPWNKKWKQYLAYSMISHSWRRKPLWVLHACVQILHCTLSFSCEFLPTWSGPQFWQQQDSGRSSSNYTT